MGFEKISQLRMHSTRHSAKTIQMNAKSAVQQAHNNTQPSFSPHTANTHSQTPKCKQMHANNAQTHNK
jgi:hypothetical protein